MGDGRDDAGFSLVELLVVVVLLVIVASIAIPSYLAQRETGYLASVKTDLHSAVIALHGTLISEGSYLPLNGATATSASLLTRGYEGADTTTLRIVASQWSYCVEARDARAPGRSVTARDSSPDMEVDGPGC